MGRLSADEQALWSRVTATVRALAGKARPDAGEAILERKRVPAIQRRESAPDLPPVKAAPPGETLDGGWDRRLRQGNVAPDRTIDLHGHTLATAHAALERALDQAVAGEARLLLVITGRPPRAGDALPRRGLIRAAIGDWLGASRHSGRIAAVRGAHPRHGGAGALYVVLRRRR